MADPQSYADSGRYFATPGSIDARRRLSQAMLRQGIDSSPIKHWTQGLGRLTQALVGGYGQYRAGEQEREGIVDLGRTVAGTDDVPAFGAPTVTRTAAAPTTTSAPAPSPTTTPETRTRQPRSIRLNNPGAIEYGDFARRAGATDSDGRFAVFPSMEAGYSAMDRLLGSYGERGFNTVKSIIERWAPRSVDNNSTDAYIAAVSRMVGVDPNAPIPQEMMPRVAEAMARFEAGVPVPRPAAAAQPETAGAQPTARTVQTIPIGPEQPPHQQPGGPQVTLNQLNPILQATRGGGAITQAAQRPAPDAAGTQPYQSPAAPPDGVPSIDDATPVAAPTAPATADPSAAPQPQGPDLIRRLLRSGNPQAIQYGLQLYRDMVRKRGSGGRYGFKSLGNQLFRTDPVTGQAVPVARAPDTGDGDTPSSVREYTFDMAQRREAGEPTVPYSQWLQERRRPLVQMNQENEYSRARGNALAEDYNKILTGGQEATGRIAQLRQIDALLSNPSVYTGTGGQMIANLKEIGKTLFGMEFEGVGPTEAARSVGNAMALDLRQNMPGTLSDRDLQFLLEMPPNISMSTEGRKLLVEMMVAREQRRVEVAQLAREYQRANGRLDEGWYDTLATYNEANPLFTPEMMERAMETARGAPQQSPAAGVLPRVQNVDDYDALESGARYIDPSGKIRTKQ